MSSGNMNNVNNGFVGGTFSQQYPYYQPEYNKEVDNALVSQTRKQRKSANQNNYSNLQGQLQGARLSRYQREHGSINYGYYAANDGKSYFPQNLINSMPPDRKALYFSNWSQTGLTADTRQFLIHGTRGEEYKGPTNSFFNSKSINQDGLTPSQLYDQAQIYFQKATALWRTDPAESTVLRKIGESILKDAGNVANGVVSPSDTKENNSLNQVDIHKAEEFAKGLQSQISSEIGGIFSAMTFLNGVVEQNKINQILLKAKQRVNDAFSRLNGLVNVGIVPIIKKEVSSMLSQVLGNINS